ncbi:polysaccharide biosynthesis protein [Paracraurococcus ruber]|uniref:Nucleotide sugar dehydratase n=1 Tax=Paracraurococcus ruber TaxID=77675 RepID=A0ABS1CUN9_9PROT|nr:nucleoside-diphosphate sugar epimerase/dehydratase [Paracraurococcus ruber]MBK1658135.1 nucleotide sugar dehydratase [Paracraurococcus ruber]TDG28877.1 polysaccharide biosynthesis protein [Paracraurococcus ruber]
MARRAPHRILLNLVLDSLIACLALPVAMLLDAPGAWPPAGWWLGALPGAALALLAAGLPVRLPQQYWRYAGLPDLLGILVAAIGAAVLFWGGLLALGAWIPPNPAFPAIHALTLGLLLGAPRIAGRLHHARRSSESITPQPVLLVGAGDGADIFIRALAAERQPAFRVAGILSMRSRQAGRRIQGHPILGTADEIAAVLDTLKEEGRLPALIVLTTHHVQGLALERLLDAADRHGIPVRRAPSVTSLDPAARRMAAMEEKAGQRLKLDPVAIEDLLDRPQIPLDREGMARLIQGRRVLVTGAGGTIGGELARQVAALGPAQLTLLDHGEFALYEIDLELRERHPDVPRRAVLADIRDEPRMRRLLEDIRPELVFHAAALKHVPMVENNPLEGLLTNALGTRVVADAAAAVGCRAMVFISTDKAVNPTSVMGASKRLAEMYCQALDVHARAADRDQARVAARGMRCVTVRFGNVLGSTGSVVPLFRRQLERGGPLTVTHPDMRRYFMTVREAVGLVLQASVIGAEDRHDQPPELAEGGIFVLDMGKPVKIVDLARRMIRLAGLRPEEDVEIRFTGLRPGEKLYEELFHGQEPPRPTEFKGLLVATPRTADPALVGRAIDEIAGACRAGSPRTALAQLGRLVPEFDHNVEGEAAAAGR